MQRTEHETKCIEKRRKIMPIIYSSKRKASEVLQHLIRKKRYQSDVDLEKLQRAYTELTVILLCKQY